MDILWGPSMWFALYEYVQDTMVIGLNISMLCEKLGLCVVYD